MNRYSFTGKGEILIKASITGKYGNKNYLKDEPIAYFTDVDIAVNFNTQGRIANAGIKNYVANSETEAAVVLVDNVRITDSLKSLLYKKQESLVRQITFSKTLESVNKEIYLPISNSEVLADYLFIYNNKKERIETHSFDKNSGLIVVQEDGTYTIFYKIEKESSGTYNLSNPSLPVLSLEIHLTGNLNGITGKAVMTFEKTKLITEPVMDFTSDQPFVSNLEFVILDNKVEPEVNYYA